MMNDLIRDSSDERPLLFSMGRRFLVMAAESNEYFPIGSVVLCEIYHNKKLEGEVLAFDPITKMLILKCPSSSGKALQSDVHIVNLNYVRDVTVKKEATSSPPPMQSLNLSRLTTRTKANTDEKMRLANAMAAGVSPEGQKLFLVISKTFEDITWKGETIVVMDRVTVMPPYRPENCNGITSDNSAAETQIRKINMQKLRSLLTTKPTKGLSQDGSLALEVQLEVSEYRSNIENSIQVTNIEKHLKDQEIQDASSNSTVVGHSLSQIQQ